MNRFDIINRIGDKYRVGNTETGEFSYAQAQKPLVRTSKIIKRLQLERNTNSLTSVLKMNVW